MKIVSIILGVIAGGVVLTLLFRPFFGDREGFIDCVKFWFKPDFFSLIDGEYFQDIWYTFKLSLWMFLGIIAGYGVYTVLMDLFG